MLSEAGGRSPRAFAQVVVLPKMGRHFACDVGGSEIARVQFKQGGDVCVSRPMGSLKIRGGQRFRPVGYGFGKRELDGCFCEQLEEIFFIIGYVESKLF